MMCVLLFFVNSETELLSVSEEISAPLCVCVLVCLALG